MSQSLEANCPRSLVENLIWRARMLDAAEKDLGLRSALREMAFRDVHFFFDGFMFTYDVRTQIKHLPFILKDRQREYANWLNQHIEDQVDGLTEKSRDMGATEVVLGTMLYRWLAKGESFLLGSRLEEMVDKRGNENTHFERLRYKLYQLPWWMMPTGFFPRIHDSYMKLHNPSRGNSITGQAMTSDFGRQGRYRAILMDEFGFIDCARDAWTATSDSTRCRLPVSTVGHGGRANFFAWLRHESKIDIFTLHYSNDPEKDAAWVVRERRRKRDEEWAREQEIDYDVGGSEQKFVRWEWLKKCRENTTNLGPDIRVIGVDVARGGDKTVISLVHGYRLVQKIVMNTRDTMKIVGEIKAQVESFGARAVILEHLGPGGGVGDRLSEQGVRVIAFSPAEASTYPERFLNIRAEMWWNTGELAREGLLTLGQDDELEKQLCAVSYEATDSRGKVKAQGKDEVKVTLGRSPDDADSVNMALWLVRALAASEIVAEHQGGPEIVTGDEIGITQRVRIGMPS